MHSMEVLYKVKITANGFKIRVIIMGATIISLNFFLYSVDCLHSSR